MYRDHIMKALTKGVRTGARNENHVQCKAESVRSSGVPAAGNKRSNQKRARTAKAVVAILWQACGGRVHAWKYPLASRINLSRTILDFQSCSFNCAWKRETERERERAEEYSVYSPSHPPAKLPSPCCLPLPVSGQTRYTRLRMVEFN